MKYKVFVDGQRGTTGLEINQRLEKRADIEILTVEPEKKKDPLERARLLNEADVAFLCLPDDAARESVSLVTNNNTCIIDASTAHRTAPGWAYGIPELSEKHREEIRGSKRISVPGCFASGFNMIMYPLVSCGIVPADYPVTCHSITGYSGGGRELIETYQAPENAAKLETPRFYALGLSHKHLPEMRKGSGLDSPPLFTPMVCNYYRGMIVAVPLHPRLLGRRMDAAQVQEFLSGYYAGQRFVKVMPLDEQSNLDNGYLGANLCNDTNNMELFVFGHGDQMVVMARFDNLGKGASGAAVQNMNIALGLDESTGLI